jgi:uncharacterized membrane protein
MNQDPVVQRYLATLDRNLKGLAPEERGEIIAEIESHLAEAARRGEDAATTIRHLGPADRLARAYRTEIILERRDGNQLWRMLAFTALLMGASIPTLIIVVTLGVMGVGLVTGGVTVAVIALFPSGYAPLAESPPELLDRAIGLVIAGALILAGAVSLGALALYMRTLAGAFRRVFRATW